MRARVWRSKLCPSTPYPPLTLVSGPCDEQIRLDVKRTFGSEKWFDPHRETIISLLNTFSVVNEGFGYPQGLNYLIFPLFYVYMNDDEEHAIEDTFYSLHSLVRIVLPMYPLDSNDKGALQFIQTIGSVVRLKCVDMDPELRILFEDDHVMFLDSIVSCTLPGLYANIFSLHDTLLLWDKIFEKKTFRKMFQSAVSVLQIAILYHKNIFLHLSVDKCMQVFQTVLSVSISTCSAI